MPPIPALFSILPLLALSLCFATALPLPAQPSPAPTAYDPPQTTSGAALRVTIYDGNKVLTTPPFPQISIQEPYTHLEGITTFRGGPRRDNAAFGATRMTTGILSVQWRHRTGKSKWGGGAAWTGQPVVVRWPENLRRQMSIREPFRTQKGFTEVIQASPSGHVYFLDLATGKPSRDPITVGNPIKGSVAVDPRGYPLLYVGEGIKENGPMGFHIYDLVTNTRIWRMPGLDSVAPKGWSAFDPSPLVDAATDTLILTAENGLLYLIRLNTAFDPSNGAVTVTPQAFKYRYSATGARRSGIESSAAVHANIAYFADNGGIVQAVNLRSMKPLWHSALGDDADATVAVDVENGTPIAYAGSEVDLQGISGLARLRRFHGLDGTVEWERTFACRSVLGDRPVNGGMLASPVIGRHLVDDLIFVKIARCPNLTDGLLTALHKETGETVWERTLKNYSWSSPVAIYTPDGVGFLLQGDSGGTLWLLDAATGEGISSVKLGGIIEASPVFFEDMIVVGTRNNEILGIRLQ